MLSITDVYHSWWFIGLLAVLSVNIIICSLNRFKSILIKPKIEVNDDFISRLDTNTKISYKKEGLENVIITALKNKNYKIKMTSTGLFGEKGKIGRLGSFITHLSILIILLGGIISSLGGFKEFIHLHEQKITQVPYTDLYIKLNKFWLEYYPNSQMIKDYKCNLTIIENKSEILAKTIEVNYPLAYKGIRFYLVNYGIEAINEVTINVNGRDFRVKIGEGFKIPDGDLKVKAVDFIPDFVIAKGKVFSRSNEPNNPAVLLEIYEDAALKYKEWVFYKFPGFHHQHEKGIKFILKDFHPSYYTELDVVKDPGVKVVWVGSTLLIIGLIISFTIFHRRIWVIINKKEDGCTVILGASSNKDKPGLLEEFKQMIQEITLSKS